MASGVPVRASCCKHFHSFILSPPGRDLENLRDMTWFFVLVSVLLMPKLGLEHLGPSTESIGVVHTSRAHVETTPPRRLRRQRRSLVAPWASAARGKSVGSPAQAAWPSLPSLRGWLAAKRPSGASNRRHRCRRSLRIAVRDESRVGARQGAWEVAPRARGGFV